MENQNSIPAIFKVWTVDTVAECWDDVGPDLSRRLWSFVKADSSPKTADIWDQLTQEERDELITLASNQE